MHTIYMITITLLLGMELRLVKVRLINERISGKSSDFEGHFIILIYITLLSSYNTLVHNGTEQSQV